MTWRLHRQIVRAEGWGGLAAKGRSLLDNAAHDVRKEIEPTIPGLAKY